MPAYPRAGGLQQEARPIANAGTAYTQRFLTADPPQSVFRFYDDYLLKHGWRRAYEWHYTETRACPVYALTVTAIANSEGQTQVTVSWSPEECKRI